MSMMVSFVLSFFPRDVLDEILNLIGSVSEGFPSYSFKDENELNRLFPLYTLLTVSLDLPECRVTIHLNKQQAGIV